jgi:uncharacterized small protein (DUF1192 family)
MARDDDDALPKPSARLERLPLDMLGIDELQAYIDELRAEITRVEMDIARKQSHRSTADAFFRKT